MASTGTKSFTLPGRGFHQQQSSIIIGIDFGTTFSGVAWALSVDPDDINYVTEWDSSLGRHANVHKTPSEILYSNDHGEPLWGYGIPLEQEGFKWFKLLLADPQDLKEEVRNSRQLSHVRRLVAESGRTPVQVVADYLRLLWCHTVADMKKQKGDTLIDSLPFCVVLTVPAIWKHDAIERTKDAASLAGIMKERPAGPTEFVTVAEPEAAALATLSDFRKRPDIAVGNVYVVCDAGGGTADLISYIVQSTDPLTVAEYVPGDGRLCGAIFVDHAFINYMKTKVQRWDKLGERAVKKMLYDEWETGIKKDFDGRDKGKTWAVAVPVEAFSGRFRSHNITDKERGIESGNALLKSDTVENFFMGPVSQIRDLVSDQITKTRQKSGRDPKAVLLVGGFGSCRYLKHELDLQYGKSGIEIHQANGYKPWTAICRGALIKGLIVTRGQSAEHAHVVSRISRLNYGLLCNPVFIEGKHNILDKVWDERECVWRATHQTEWLLRKGADVLESTATPIQFNYYQLLDAPLPNNTLESTIYQSEEDDAGPRGNVPTVKKLCNLSCRPDVEFEDLPLYVNKHNCVYHKIEYTITMAWSGAALDWTMVINGREQSKASMQVSFDSAPGTEAVPSMDEGISDGETLLGSSVGG